VILNDPRRSAAPGIGTRATLDDLLTRAAKRRPDTVALIDPPNRESFTDGAPRRLTYAQADRMVSAIAGRLRRIGLHADAIVALQMANTVDSLLTLLGVLRAGLIAMPLPLLWRRAEAVAALSRVGASALVVNGRVGDVDHFELAMHIAAEIFPVRYVLGYGRETPDGLIPLDGLFGLATLDPVPAMERERALPPGPSAHLAVITWDVSPQGLVPVGRSHAEMIAGGLAVLLESHIEQDAVILSTIPGSSFAGIAIGVLPWLLSGGTLALHHPFDAATFAAQCQSVPCDGIIVPGPLVPQLAEAGHFSRCARLKKVLSVWRAPERLARALAWRDGKSVMTDIQVFGETGLLAAQRGSTGRPAAIPFGPVMAPRGAKGAVMVAEVTPTSKGTVALRGPMVPRCAFPPGAERTQLPYFTTAANGFVDTGYACRIDRDASAMIVTGPPPGIASVGGYRFVIRELQDMIDRIEASATLTALPDALAGHRLAGNAADRAFMQDALSKLGVNPLLVGAFRDRRRGAA